VSPCYEAEAGAEAMTGKGKQLERSNDNEITDEEMLAAEAELEMLAAAAELECLRRLKATASAPVAAAAAEVAARARPASPSLRLGALSSVVSAAAGHDLETTTLSHPRHLCLRHKVGCCKSQCATS